jgi:hypothetical protein
MEATNPNWKRDAPASKKKEEKRARLEERAKEHGAELAAAGLTVEDLFPTSRNKETTKKYNAAMHILNATAINKNKAAKYLLTLPPSRRKKLPSTSSTLPP